MRLRAKLAIALAVATLMVGGHSSGFAAEASEQRREALLQQMLARPYGSQPIRWHSHWLQLNGKGQWFLREGAGQSSPGGNRELECTKQRLFGGRHLRGLRRAGERQMNSA